MDKEIVHIHTKEYHSAVKRKTTNMLNNMKLSPKHNDCIYMEF